MSTLLWISILLTAFSFLLKQTFWRFGATLLTAVIAAGFVVAMWPYAIEQSKTQLADWLVDSALMLNTSVVLTIEVALQMAFCLLTVHVTNVDPVKKRVLWGWRILYWFPGVLIFPVLFFALTQLIFAMPGISFQQVAWGCGIGVAIVIPLGRLLILWLLPEEELRLELFFLLNALIAVLGIVATVNGRTAVDGVATVEWPALTGCIGLILAGGLLGWWFSTLRKRYR